MANKVMKKKIFAFLPLFALLLSGCSLLEMGMGRNSSSGDSQTSSQVNSSSHYTSSGSTSSDSRSGTAKVEIYTTNDLHGQVYDENYRCGIGRLGTFLKEKGAQSNTLLIDQGDTWQGSIYSNYNHGALMTDIMNIVQYDAKCVGNHDFDWGIEPIINNNKMDWGGYRTPSLAGNVYSYDFQTKTEGNIQRSDIGVPSVKYTLENGLRVGILGGIGSNQITSINSQYTQDICFKDHIAFIKSEATKLRKEGCDIVITSIHTGQESVMYQGLENYVDLVLCGHTHQQEIAHEDSTFYVQNYGYGGSISKIDLKYSFDTHKLLSTTINQYSGYDIINATPTVDAVIQHVIDIRYGSSCSQAASEVLATNVTGEFSANGYAENLMATAVFNYVTSLGYDVCMSYVNDARHYLPAGTWTYADLYQSFPFDNVVYIAEIKGYEVINEIKNWNYIYRNSTFTTDTIYGNQTYTIAILDYLYFHTNSNRYYDYFSYTGGTSTTTVPLNYREILRQFLIDGGYQSGNALNPYEYSSSLWRHDRTAFTLA